VRQLMEVAKDTKSGGIAEGAHVHVVHLSDAEDSLSHIMVCVCYVSAIFSSLIFDRWLFFWIYLHLWFHCEIVGVFC